MRKKFSREIIIEIYDGLNLLECMYRKDSSGFRIIIFGILSISVFKSDEQIEQESGVKL